MGEKAKWIKVVDVKTWVMIVPSGLVFRSYCQGCENASMVFVPMIEKVAKEWIENNKS